MARKKPEQYYRTTGHEEIIYEAVLAGELEVRPDGTIWRLAQRVWGPGRRSFVLKPCKHRRAERRARRKYLQVARYIRGRAIRAGAHRVVYRYFHGPIPVGLSINHKDGNPSNNHPDNLELATRTQQQMHALYVLWTSPIMRGEDNTWAKITSDQVVEIRTRHALGERLCDLSVAYGICKQQVSRICRGERWGHKHEHIPRKLRKRGGTRSLGESNPKCKITAAQVVEIRSSTLSCKELASKYPVNLQTIYKIRARQLWKHL